MENLYSNNQDNPIDSLIAKILGGSASSEEILQLENWTRESHENHEYFRQMQNIWLSSSNIPVSSDEAINTVMQQIGETRTRQSFIQIWQKVAAILILPIILSATILFYKSYHKAEIPAKDRIMTVAAAFGSVTSVELPDGTRVWLNSGSKLSYPETFDQESRNVKLSGEAYFEVKSDVNHPFFVQSDFLRVKATGTRFNVSAYKGSASSTVSLAEGKVTVYGNSAENKEEEIAVLRPDQSVKYMVNDRKSSIVNEDSYKHFAWKDGKMVFRNDPLSEVAERISLQYDVDIRIKGEDVKNYRYRATFENESLQEVLFLLKLSSPFNYQITDQKIAADGTFSKKKVVIYSSHP